MARLECDRCERTLDDISADLFDEIVGAMPEAEVEAGLLMLRCTAWPASAHA